MIYLRKFETQAQYTAAESSLILPNVSLITETNGVAYKPYVPPAPETRIVAKFDVTSINEPTPISYKYVDEWMGVEWMAQVVLVK